MMSNKCKWEGNFMDKELKNYIEKEIKSKYRTFDKGHNINHYNNVTKNCTKYAKLLNEEGQRVDVDIAYIVGAYHDIGMIHGREEHAVSSGKIVREDKMLRKYYSNDIIEQIAMAVEDHSSHTGREPRNIYGKIVADADRSNTLYLVFSRPIKFGLKNDPKSWSRQQRIDSVYQFVQGKFGRNGYVKYWLNIPDTTKEQNAVWELLDKEHECKAYIAGIFDEVSKGKYK